MLKKKAQAQKRGGRRSDGSVSKESDPIQNSVGRTVSDENSSSIPCGGGASSDGIGLEVVLPMGGVIEGTSCLVGRSGRDGGDRVGASGVVAIVGEEPSISLGSPLPVEGSAGNVRSDVHHIIDIQEDLGMTLMGDREVVVNQRLKVLKGVIKEWKNKKFGKAEEEKSRLINEILALDLRSETLGLVDVEVGERKMLFEKLWNLLKSIDAMTFQRSRSRWLREGILLPQNNLNDFECFIFKNIWKSPVPSKVCALAWQVCLDRIPTKEKLVTRRIITSGDALCPVCGDTVETLRHLFLHCRFAAAVWYRVNQWLGTMVVIPPDIRMSYGLLVGCGGNKKIRRGYSIVWLAFVWVIWRCRNDQVFNNINGKEEEAVDSIQRLSWQWYLQKTARGSSLLYEWVWNPGDCMLR
ncbi:hypothetical protein TSUD_128680 [Trifolium subterraneum]|uniref:Reverse transcriptase zinc-binding domain-containing protein n=1 Tax=Trifolium subterraneum TaxID=3900 RepID=A0A2Z6M147_TRISU|nr:hypothetical protein TSUD_128680 [Trifolium subterraneum]